MSAHQTNTRKVFDSILYSALDWPGKTTRLGRDSLEDYLQRPASWVISLAELYHENSKLYASRTATLLAARTDAGRFRHEALERSAAAFRAATVPAGAPVPEKLRKMLYATKAALGTELFYAVELRLVVEGRLLAWEPLSEALAALKELSRDEAAMLAAALEVMGTRRGHGGPLLFVLGWFARNELLLGARGYRRTLLEAGRVVEGIVSQAALLGLGTEVLMEFTDVDADRAAEVDGVEQGTVAVIVFLWGDDEQRQL